MRVPFDELLYIQRGRHYGFPPRHPKYLPNVIDEPSAFDYMPQHQSACGLFFNESVAEGGKLFGPERWRHEAFVTGFSRGRLWLTSLAKTAAGYVAKNETIACMKHLPIDLCSDLEGRLLVSTLGGIPDWGNSPAGHGFLYKIAYKQQKWQDAANFLEAILSKYPTDILGDDATFYLAELYDYKLNDKAKAMQYYQDLFVKYPGSLFVVDARKRYRQLRGDKVAD